jgi:DNA-binding SARP family transcriptional activator
MTVDRNLYKMVIMFCEVGKQGDQMRLCKKARYSLLTPPQMQPNPNIVKFCDKIQIQNTKIQKIQIQKYKYKYKNTNTNFVIKYICR